MPRHDSGDGWVIFILLHPILVDEEAQRRPAVEKKSFLFAAKRPVCHPDASWTLSASACCSSSVSN